MEAGEDRAGELLEEAALRRHGEVGTKPAGDAEHRQVQEPWSEGPGGFWVIGVHGGYGAQLVDGPCPGRGKLMRPELGCWLKGQVLRTDRVGGRQSVRVDGWMDRYGEARRRVQVRY